MTIGDSYLFGKDSDVLVEALRRAHVTACDTRFTRRTCRQFTLLENQREKREQWMSATRKNHDKIKINLGNEIDQLVKGIG